MLQAPGQNSTAYYFPAQIQGVRDQPAFRQMVEELDSVEHWQLCGWPEVCRPVGVDGFECD